MPTEFETIALQDENDDQKKNKINNYGRKQDKKLVIISAILATIGILFIVIMLPIYYKVIKKEPPTEEIIIEENKRFNCMPDKNPTSEECQQRGCIWLESQTPNAPSCFYSGKESSYQSASIEETEFGVSAVFSISSQTKALQWYGQQFEKLKVDIIRMTRQRLQIKIKPLDQERFEVPIESDQPNPENFPKNESLYRYEITKEGNPGLKVWRRDTDKLIFDTNVGHFIFADQFLQVSSRLSSNYVYGFGEQEHENFKHSLDWKKHGMFSRDQGVGQNANLYGVHPFHMTMEGDGNFHGILFLNSNAQEIELQPMPAVTYRTIGGIMDFNIFMGPNPESVIDQYTQMIGRPYMPPFWSLGFQLCRYGYDNLENLTRVVNRMLESEIPYDIQYSDIDYMERQLDFTIDQDSYKGLEEFVVNLKEEHHMKYIIILDPAISANESSGTYPPFESGVEKDVFIMDETQKNLAYGKVWPDLPGIFVNLTWDWDSQVEAFRSYAVFPDFAKEVTKEWWTDHIVDFYQRIPFDGLWIDMNEPASFVHGSPNGCPVTKYDEQLPFHPGILGDKIYDKTLCMSYKQYNPTTNKSDELHYNMHSLYGRLQIEPTLSACRSSTNERCIVVTRSTYPGSGKYGGHWLGDNTSMWKHLRSSIIGLLEFNLFGIPYVGADICGFFQDTTRELCLRWSQLGAFYPFSRNHNSIGYKDQDPASFDAEFEAAVAKILKIRYRIMPYFYTLFFKANTQGSTVVRSLMAEFSSDEKTYDISEQFMLGDSILITPVLDEGQSTVTGYFPNTRWFDYYSGEVMINKGEEVSLDAPLDVMPIHTKGGSIIAVQKPEKTLQLQRNNNFGVLYSIGDEDVEGKGELFWDDGNSINTIEEMKYLHLKFTGTQTTLVSTVVHDGYSTSLKFDSIEVLGVYLPDIKTVMVNNQRHFDFIFDSSISKLTIKDLSINSRENWTISWDNNIRSSCLPGKGSISQDLCEDKGCLWDEAFVGSNKDPPCYYPYGFQSYKVSEEETETPQGIDFKMEYSGSNSFFSPTIKQLQVSTHKISSSQLRVKIFDANNDRFEVPLTMNEPSSSGEEEKYDVELKQDEVSGAILEVKRHGRDESIATMNLGKLIFENQFLQLSMSVSTQLLYGFGEFEKSSFRQNFDWSKLSMFTRDESVKPDANLYGHQPFFMRLETDGSAHGILLLNSNAMEVELSPDSIITWRTTGGIFDFHIFMGPSPEEVIQQYTGAIGRPMMPPYWALGYQLSKYGYNTLEEMEKVVEENRALNIPHDVQYGDIDTMERGLDFTFDPDNFGGLPEYVNKMRDEYNMHYVIILDPAISVNETEVYSPYTNGISNDIFIKKHNGDILLGEVWPFLPIDDGVSKAHVAFPDFFKSSTHHWWSNELKTFYEKLKFDGVWIDMNEPTNFRDGAMDGCPYNIYEEPPFIPNILGDALNNKTLCMSSKQEVSGKSELHYNVHSLYGWSQSQPTLSGCREATGKRCFVISRSTYPGAGSHTGHWFGDNISKWSHMHASIISMFDFSLFGFSYTGADICGFFGNATSDLCKRWSQLGAFYPFSRNHADLFSSRQDPAAFGDEFASDVRKILQTRYRLLPYLYTLFYHSHTDGSSVVRPLLNEYQYDSNTYDIDRQFLWGPALMITPALDEDAVIVDAYIPNDRWFNFYDGEEVMTKETTVQLQTPKDQINLHLRGGHILITQQPGVNTHSSRKNDFELIIALNDDQIAKGDMFWDDGDTINVGIDSIHMNFIFTENQLTNQISWNTFKDSDTLSVRRIIIMGLKDEVKAVYQNSDVLFTFDQDPTTQTLTINLPRTQLDQEFVIKLDFTDEEIRRIDCWPDLTEEVTQEKCESRSCIWMPSNNKLVPHCFFNSSSNEHKYKVTENVELEGSRRSTLTPYLSPVIYGEDFTEVHLDLFYETSNRLHFKFTDAMNDRWEIPQSLVHLSNTDGDVINKDAALYRVTIEEEPFSMRIFHKDDLETALIDTSVGPLKLNDQFLQVSTKLPSTNIYGFGGHNHHRLRHDLNWKRWGIFARDVAPVDEWNLYSHHPFFMATTSDGSTSFGLFLHNSNAMDVLLQPLPALTYRVTGGVLDFYFFVGETPEEVIKEYTSLIGFPVMPPYWALGFHLSQWNYGNLSVVREVYQEMRDAGIPYDVQFGDIDYMDAKKDFTYDLVAYEGLPDFINELHENNMRYIPIIDPGIAIEHGYKAYDDGIDQNIFIQKPDKSEPVKTKVWPGDTYHPDFTHPNITSWYTDQCRDFRDVWNITFDALWIDMNEPSNFQPDDPIELAEMNCTGSLNFPNYIPRILDYNIGLHDKSICMNNLHHNDVLHYNVHSLYGHTMSMTTYQALQKILPTKRSLVLTRSSYPGTGRYAATWTGDNQSFWAQLRDSIPSIIEHTMFGMPMVGADICGFWGKPSLELCIRWTQLGAFYPFCRNHNADTWPLQHPTAFKSETMTRVAKEVLMTRYTILPYLYTEFYRVNLEGGTVARSLAHEFPTDPETWNINYQFLLGSSFLITPVVHENATSVVGYFPADNRWFDYYTGKEVEDIGRFIKLTAPLDYINLHVRGGSIIPTQIPEVTTFAARKNSMKLIVALDSYESAEGSLYWDDGEARDVENNFLFHQFTCESVDGVNQIKSNIISQPENLFESNSLSFEEISIFGVKEQPTSLQVNGIPHTSYTFDDGVIKITSLALLINESFIVTW